MLNPSKLPRFLWAEACNTATYILNHTGKTKIDKKSPYELWFGKKLENLNHLKIFGTECYVHVQKQFRFKFDNKALKGHLVGYVNERDGYRIWIPSKNKIIRTHDVRFKPEVVCNKSNDVVEVPVEYEHSSSQTEMQSEIEDSEDTEEVSDEDASVFSEELEDKASSSSKRTRKKPGWMTSGEYVCLAQDTSLPKLYQEAIESEDQKS